MSKINKIKVNNIEYDIEDTSKQEILISGTNIKTINGSSILGQGNIEISGGSGTSNYTQLLNKPKINNIELNENKTSSDLNLQDKLVSGTNIKTINNQSILGNGNINISGGEAISVGNIQFDLVEESE